jgi:hypothetical protein
MVMGRIRELLIASSVLLLCLPLAVLLTLMLLPVWSWMGTNWAIAAVGPSGPAPWCFILVYGLMAAVCLGVVVLRWRGSRG